METTAIIRRVILDEVPGWKKLPCTIEQKDCFWFDGALVAKEVTPIQLPEEIGIEGGFSHFLSHIEKAAKALGIEIIQTQ